MSRKVYVPYKSVAQNLRFGTTSGLCYIATNESNMNEEFSLKEAREECEAGRAKVLGSYFKCDQCETNFMDINSVKNPWTSKKECIESPRISQVIRTEDKKEIIAIRYYCQKCKIKADIEADQRALLAQ